MSSRRPVGDLDHEAALDRRVWRPGRRGGPLHPQPAARPVRGVRLDGIEKASGPARIHVGAPRSAGVQVGGHIKHADLAVGVSLHPPAIRLELVDERGRSGGAAQVAQLRIEPAGEPVPLLHNTLRGWTSLPVRVEPS